MNKNNREREISSGEALTGQQTTQTKRTFIFQDLSAFISCRKCDGILTSFGDVSLTKTLDEMCRPRIQAIKLDCVRSFTEHLQNLKNRFHRKEFHYFFLDGLDRKKIFLDTILVDFDLKKRKKGM